ncbi:HIG1 domain member 1A, mitochondrial [Homalodisca vitripennis]|nr:HIG1 domain member 1A, mitochondrial [Homalodisca vitripennis]
MTSSLTGLMFYWQKNTDFGLLGFVGALGYGAYKYKHRGEMSRSLFFVQLRVGAQSMVVGALVISIALSLGKRLLNQTSREH